MLAEAASDLGGERAGRPACWRPGAASAAIRRARRPRPLRVAGGEEPGRAEGLGLGAGWSEQVGAPVPLVPGVTVGRSVEVGEVPALRADQEARQHRVEGGGRADAAQQPQVPVLRGDDFGQPGQARLRVVDLVRRADPNLVAGADVSAVAEQVQHWPAWVAGVAAAAAALWLMAQREPVRFRRARLDDGAFEPVPGLGGEQVAVEAAGGTAFGLRAAGLLPEVFNGHVMQRGEPGEVGDGDLLVCGPDRDGQAGDHQRVPAEPARRRRRARVVLVAVLSSGTRSSTSVVMRSVSVSMARMAAPFNCNS